MSSGYAFVDLETVCLPPGDDVIWEIGVIFRDRQGPDYEWSWQVRPNISKLSDWSRPDFEKRFVVPDGAEAMGWGPMSDPTQPGTPMSHETVASMLISMTHKRHIVGAVPDFDTWRLWFYVQRHTVLTPSWHYHLQDIEGMAVGYLKGIEEGVRRERRGQLTTGSLTGAGARQPAWLNPDGSWESDTLYRAVGIKPEKYERHTALGDSRLNRDVYDVIFSQ